MKKLALIPMLCLSLFLTAQKALPAHQILKDVLKKSPDAVVLKDKNFSATLSDKYTCLDYVMAIKVIPESGVDLKTPADSLIKWLPKVKKQPDVYGYKDEYVLKINEKGVKQITFECTKTGDKLIYELMIEFENADSTRKLAEMMLGEPNHPTLKNYWVGDVTEDKVVSLLWTNKKKLVFASNLPTSEYENEPMFKLSDEFIKTFREKKYPQTEVTPEEKPEEKPKETSDNEATSQVINTLIAAANKDFEEYKIDLLPNKKEEYNAEAFVAMGQEQAVIRKNAAGNWRLEVRFPSFATVEEAKEAFENSLAFYQTLEGLEYRLVKKSDLTTANGRTYVWDVQTLDDEPLGVVLKWQLYPMSNGQFGMKMELGK
jgi:hypothetical protein